MVHLVRMPPGHLLMEVFQACPAGRRPRGRSRSRWRDYISALAWECLAGISPLELADVNNVTVVLGTSLICKIIF